MQAIAAAFGAEGDVLGTRAALAALGPPPRAVAGGILGAAGQANDGASLLAIHIEDERVGLVRAIIEEHGGTVLAVIPLLGI
jgi:hypothetical protein